MRGINVQLNKDTEYMALLIISHLRIVSNLQPLNNYFLKVLFKIIKPLIIKELLFTLISQWIFTLNGKDSVWISSIINSDLHCIVSYTLLVFHVLHTNLSL